MKMTRKTGAVAVIFLLAALVAVIMTACSSQDHGASIELGTLPETTEEHIPEGTLYVRCSEPEGNTFSIQFIGAVPTRNVDYVGFEASEIYSDGTKSQRSTIKLYELYSEISDNDTGEKITAEDFGFDDGYLYVRALDGIPTTDPELTYEILTYYVIGGVKYYTACQAFRIHSLLEEHILSDPVPLEHKETSPIMDIQKWVRYTFDPEDTEQAGGEAPEAPTALPKKTDYFLGAGVPDNNGNLSVYVCFPVNELANSAVGLRYAFRQLEGENAGMSTSATAVRTNLLYDRVITSSETLTIDDFGLSEGYLAVIEFNINTVIYNTFSLDVIAYTARNAVESTVIDIEIPISKVVSDTVIRPYAIPEQIYTFVPQNYNEWMFCSEENGNARGEGLLLMRTSRLISSGELTFSFNVQIAAAIETRFVDEIFFEYVMYNQYGDEEKTGMIPVSVVYSEIFDDENGTFTSEDLGQERGYIFSMLLNGLDLSDDEYTYKISAFYEIDGERTTVASLSIDAQTLIDTIPGAGEIQEEYR